MLRTSSRSSKLEMEIRNNIPKKNHEVLAIFLDLKSAFDVVQREVLLQKLKQANITGQMFNYIQNFLTGRKFNVKVGSALSDTFEQQNGVPQGSILSPILFLLAINDVDKQVKKGTKVCQYADDAAIFKAFQNGKGRGRAAMIEYMNKEVERVVTHLKSKGFKINTIKTQVVLFTNNKDNKVTINVGGDQIASKNEAKYLGVTLDSKLTFKTHILDLEKKGRRALQVMSYLKSKGGKIGHPTTLKVVYKNLVEARSTYGQELFRDGNKTELGKLDRIQNKALKILVSAPKCTTTEGIQALTGEPPPEIKRETAQLKFWARLSSQSDNSVADMLNDKQNSKLIKKNYSLGLARRVQSRLNELGINQNSMQKNPTLFDTQKWEKIVLDEDLARVINKKTDSEIKMKTSTLEHIDIKYKDYKKIYTDGSKIGKKVGIGIHSKDLDMQESDRITDNCAIITAELKAISKTICILNERANDINKGRENVEKMKKTVILTDSLSSLDTLAYSAVECCRFDLVKEINETYTQLSNKGVRVEICWIPAHCGILGNDIADQLAKDATSHMHAAIETKLGQSEMIAELKQLQKVKWDEIYKNSNKAAFTKSFIPSVIHNKIHLSGINAKRIRFILNNPRFKAMQDKKCDVCSQEKTTEHVLINCQIHNKERDQLKEVFDSQNISMTVENILSLNQSNIVENASLIFINTIKEII